MGGDMKLNSTYKIWVDVIQTDILSWGPHLRAKQDEILILLSSNMSIFQKARFLPMLLRKGGWVTLDCHCHLRLLQFTAVALQGRDCQSRQKSRQGDQAARWSWSARAGVEGEFLPGGDFWYFNKFLEFANGEILIWLPNLEKHNIL